MMFCALWQQNCLYLGKEHILKKKSMDDARELAEFPPCTLQFRYPWRGQYQMKSSNYFESIDMGLFINDVMLFRRVWIWTTPPHWSSKSFLA